MHIRASLRLVQLILLLQLIVRKEAKKIFLKVYEEKCNHYNLGRNKSRNHNLVDLVGNKRTQQEQHLKIKSIFGGPYKVTKRKSNDT